MGNIVDHPIGKPMQTGFAYRHTGHLEVFSEFHLIELLAVLELTIINRRP